MSSCCLGDVMEVLEGVDGEEASRDAIVKKRREGLGHARNIYCFG